MIDIDESLGETVLIEESTVKESTFVVGKVCEDEKVDDNTYIYNVSL